MKWGFVNFIVESASNLYFFTNYIRKFNLCFMSDYFYLFRIHTIGLLNIKLILVVVVEDRRKKIFLYVHKLICFG